MNHHYISRSEAEALNKPSSVNSRLLSALKWLEGVTDIQWRMTSFKRNSPNHKDCVSLDVAPFEEVPTGYATQKQLDPLLPNRIEFVEHLIKALPASATGVAYFIESDHIHIQCLADVKHPPLVVRWPGPKGHCYHMAERDDITGRPGSPSLKTREYADHVIPAFTGYDERNQAYPKAQISALLLRDYKDA